MHVGATLAVARTARRAVPPHAMMSFRDVPSRRATARVRPYKQWRGIIVRGIIVRGIIVRGIIVRGIIAEGTP